MKRKIISIDENLCNGCGRCASACPEGAIQMIDGKARLVSEIFCDGLGACIGDCPVGAITTVEREAVPYDEIATLQNIIRQGPGVIAAHLAHLKRHGQTEFYKQAAEYLKTNSIPFAAEEKHACAFRAKNRNRRGGRRAHKLASAAAPDKSGCSIFQQRRFTCSRRLHRFRSQKLPVRNY